MRLSDLLAFEGTLQHLSYSYEIVRFNKKYSYMKNFDDVPFPSVTKIRISNSTVYEPVNGQNFSWRVIFKTFDSLIPMLRNPNEIYLEDISLNEQTLLVSLGS